MLRGTAFLSGRVVQTIQDLTGFCRKDISCGEFLHPFDLLQVSHPGDAAAHFQTHHQPADVPPSQAVSGQPSVLLLFLPTQPLTGYGGTERTKGLVMAQMYSFR